MANTHKKVDGIPHVLTANRLLEGDVVYLTAAGDWSTVLTEAVVIEGAEEESRRLAQADEAVAARRVVGPYLMQVAAQGGVPQPLSQREHIRARRGPTAGSTLRDASIGS